MSRRVIRDIVIPIVSKIISEEGYFPHYVRPRHHPHFNIRDKRLEEFLEEEMRRRFGVIGANDCQHLREQLEEAKKNDPYSFDFLVRQLLDKYVKLAAKVRYAKRSKRISEAPPDRFSRLRKARHNPFRNYE